MSTINERKYLRLTTIGFLINYISLFIFGWSIREPKVILGLICISGYFIGLGLLFYGSYSLGWEYKRLDVLGGKDE